jgi:putative flippase GtrA
VKRPDLSDNLNSKKSLFGESFRYLLVGGSTALLELLLFQALFSFTALSAAVANVIAVLVATLTNFLLNRSFTFKSTSNPFKSMVLYALLFAFNVTFSSSVIQLIVDAGGISWVAKLITMVCIVSWNFFLFKKVVFK